MAKIPPGFTDGEINPALTRIDVVSTSAFKASMLYDRLLKGERVFIACHDVAEQIRWWRQFFPSEVFFVIEGDAGFRLVLPRKSGEKANGQDKGSAE